MARRGSRWSAAVLLLTALILVPFGAWAAGALAFGSAVLVWGVDSVVSGEDRAVRLVLVVAGAGSVLGVVGHLASGVDT